LALRHAGMARSGDLRLPVRNREGGCLNGACAVLLVLAVVLAAPASHARAAGERFELALCPRPQYVDLLPDAAGADFSRGFRERAVSARHAPVRYALDRLDASVRKARGVGPDDAAPSFLGIGLLDDWRKTRTRPRPPMTLLQRCAGLPAEGYALSVRDGKAWIVGKDARGTVYGVETFAQLIGTSMRLPAIEIRDFPDTPFRMIYARAYGAFDARVQPSRVAAKGAGEFDHGAMDALTKDIVRLVLHYKTNMLVLEDSAFFRLDDPKTEKNLREVFDYCRQRGLEPIPGLKIFGHARYILPLEPACVETVPWKDRPFVVRPDGSAAPIVPRVGRLTVKNGDFEKGRDRDMPGWRRATGSRAALAKEGRSGGGCLRLSSHGRVGNRVFQELACASDANFVLKVDARTEGKDIAASVKAIGNGGLFAEVPLPAASPAWKTYRIHFNTKRSASLRICLDSQFGPGKAWFDNVSLEYLPPPAMCNVLRDADLPVIVKSADGATVFVEGKDYVLFPGEFRYPFRRDAKPWRIQAKPDGRIGPGDRLLVTYHWVGSQANTYCPSSPITRAFTKKALRRIVAALRPRYIHIGFDEERLVNSCARCRKRNLKAYEIFADEVRRMYGIVKEADPGITVMMWADAFRTETDGRVAPPWGNGETYTLDQALRGIPRDIVMCRWQYTSKNADRLYRSLSALAAKGFRVTGSPWKDPANLLAWRDAVRRLRAEAPDKRPGLFLTTWRNHWALLPPCADMMWTLSKPAYGKTGGGTARRIHEDYAPFETVRLK